MMDNDNQETWENGVRWNDEVIWTHRIRDRDTTVNERHPEYRIWNYLKQKGMTVEDIPRQELTPCIPDVKHIPMACDFAETDTVDAGEFDVFIWLRPSNDPWYPSMFYGWEVHRNGLWIGNSEHRLLSKIIAWDNQEDAQAAAREYIDRVVKFGVNHETP